MNKNLNELKKNLQGELSSYAVQRLQMLTEVESLIADDMYSSLYKNQKRTETTEKIAELKTKTVDKMDKHFETFNAEMHKFNVLKNISPETFEHKVTNLLEILKINPNAIADNNINFLVDSKSYDILKSFREAFPTVEVISKAFYLVDPSSDLKKGELILANAKRYCGYEYLDTVSVDKLSKAILEMFADVEEEITW